MSVSDSYGGILSCWSLPSSVPIHFHWKREHSTFINIFSFVFHGGIENHNSLEENEGV